MDEIAVLGGSGSVGFGVVNALIDKKYQPKVMVRDINQFKSLFDDEIPGPITAIQGDLDSNHAIAKVCEYADTIFICFNTDYRYWSDKMTAWVSKIGDLAANLQAKVIFPTNMYNFGTTTASPINEEEEQNATTQLGKLRIAIEQKLVKSALTGSIVSLVRLPRLFGPASFDYLIEPLFYAASQNKSCTWYGDLNNPMDLMYNMDAGKILVNVAESHHANDAMLHVSGYSNLNPEKFINEIYTESKSTVSIPTKLMKSWKIAFKSIINTNFDLFSEVLYQFNSPYLLDDTKYKQLIGEIQRTPLIEAIKKTIEWYNKRQ